MKISILCPAFNHERYVGDFIRSLLAQTEKEWELIIVDDCSSDATVARIREFQDARIHLFVHEWNRGINASMADLLARASAPLCTFIASDDLLEPEYIEEILSVADQNPDSGFGFVQLSKIDAAGRKTGKIFGKVKPEKSENIFACMFIDGVGFVSPGMFVRTALLRKIFPMPFGVCQQQDQLMILLLSFYAKPVFVHRPLVCYRQCGSGVSTLSVASCERLTAETAVVMDTAAALVKTDVELRNHFGHLQKLPADAIPPSDILFWLGRLTLCSNDPERRHWGLRQVMNAFAKDGDQYALWKRYGFSFAEYLRLFADLKIGFSREQRKISRQRKVIGALAIALAAVGLVLAAMVCSCLLK